MRARAREKRQSYIFAYSFLLLFPCFFPLRFKACFLVQVRKLELIITQLNFYRYGKYEYMALVFVY